MGSAVRVVAVTKQFGEVAALSEVSADFLPGEIHAAIGENGAGKSTLMNAVAGFVRPDSGQILVDGKPLEPGNPIAAAEAGIAMVHQHFMLVPEFTVEENLALAALRSAPLLIKTSDLADRALALGEELGWHFDPKSKTGSLGVGQQQRLEILKALATGAQILILDEPTAVLRQEEVDELFRVLRNLKSQGRTVILVAHKLAEVLAIADRVTVLRQGRHAASAPRSEVDAGQLALWMLGERPSPPEMAPKTSGNLALEAKNLRVLGDRGELRVDGASFAVRQGEILGIGGVDGNGQVELAEALAGVRTVTEGRIEFDATAIGYVPQDRHRDGLALGMTVEENLLIQGHRRSELYQGPLLSKTKAAQWADRIRLQYEIAAPNVKVLARNLSGGNQQKVVVGRTLDALPQVLILVNPTRGLDLRAAAFVRKQVRDAASGGAAVVLFSTDLDELDDMADRRLFMSAGKLAEPTAAAFLGDSA